ncbi:MAG: LA_1612 family putative O-antigen biosynthesis protein [Ilumatobacteraceae bacterium]
MIRVWRLLKSLTRLRWKFKQPKQRDVLLYFKTGAEVISPYFKPNEFQVLDLRESEVNIPIAIRCLLTGNLSAENYARQFIKVAKPKLILTFIDNFPPYYLLKNEFPNIEVWLIQNGIRSERNDLFDLLKSNSAGVNNHVDKMFVFGKAIGKKYFEYISGETVVHGSFKNNLIPISPPKNDTVAYVSTFRPSQQMNFVLRESRPETPVTYGQIISRRERVILWLAKYCAENNLKLTIVGKDENPQREENYYRSLLKNYKFEFVARRQASSSYEAIDRSEFVVFTSSTLGYESLARGKRTAALMLDAEIIGAEALKFGWPAKLQDDGPFWTHQLNEVRLYEILDFLREVDDAEWDKIRTQTIKDVIVFDPDNSKFRESVDQIRQSWQLQQSNN